MTERSDRSEQSGETTSVFMPDGQRDGQSGHETTHLERPNLPLGSPAPPWQRVQHSTSEHDSYRPGPVLADQPTIAEQRPSYAPPLPNGAPPVQNPFLTPKDQTGAPPPVHPDQPIPLGGPGAIPVGGHGAIAVGGPSGPAGPGARHPGARPTAHPSAVRNRTTRAPRKASLQIRRFDPWSVLKLSLVLSVAMFLMWLVAVGVLYGVLDGMGVWDKLNGAYSDLASVNDESGGAEPLISAGRVFGVSAVVGVVNIVLFTAFATVLAFVYNVSADLAGGIEVTLSERD